MTRQKRSMIFYNYINSTLRFSFFHIFPISLPPQKVLLELSFPNNRDKLGSRPIKIWKTFEPIKIKKMAKEISGFVKLQVKGGQANPAPPVGPALGSKGVNIMEFCKQFNARTQDKMGKVLPVLITVYTDKSFDFVIKTPPAAVQLNGSCQNSERFQRKQP